MNIKEIKEKENPKTPLDYLASAILIVFWVLVGGSWFLYWLERQ